MRLTSPPKKLIRPVVDMWENRKEFLNEVGATFAGIAIERIEKRKAGPDGVKWAPWAKSTRKARRKEGSSSTGLLLRTGNLRDKITHKVQGQKVIIYTKAKYGQYLQNGTKNMPARPFLGSGKREERELKYIWKQWMAL